MRNKLFQGQIYCEMISQLAALNLNMLACLQAPNKTESDEQDASRGSINSVTHCPCCRILRAAAQAGPGRSAGITSCNRSKGCASGMVQAPAFRNTREHAPTWYTLHGVMCHHTHGLQQLVKHYIPFQHLLVSMNPASLLFLQSSNLQLPYD